MWNILIANHGNITPRVVVVKRTTPNLNCCKVVLLFVAKRSSVVPRMQSSLCHSRNRAVAVACAVVVSTASQKVVPTAVVVVVNPLGTQNLTTPLSHNQKTPRHSSKRHNQSRR